MPCRPSPGRLLLLLLSHGAKLDEATDEGCAVNGRLAKPAMELNRFWIPTTGGVYRDTDLDDGVRQCRVSFRWLLGGVDIEYLPTYLQDGKRGRIRWRSLVGVQRAEHTWTTVPSHTPTPLFPR